MSNYNLKPITLPSLLTLDAKEKRKKVLAAVRQRRKIIYQRFRKNIQQQADRDVI